jgi:hypothetical protein
MAEDGTLQEPFPPIFYYYYYYFDAPPPEVMQGSVLFKTYLNTGINMLP